MPRLIGNADHTVVRTFAHGVDHFGADHSGADDQRGGRRAGGALLGVAVLGVLLALVGVWLAFAARPSVHGPAGRSEPLTAAPPADPVTDPAVTPLASASSPTPVPSTNPATRTGGDVAAVDVVAARPMPTLPLSSAMPGPVSTRDPGPVIVVPECPDTGPAGVPTGCPHTQAGALAQLIAIDRAALQSGTMGGARQVIAAWALPGGPTTTSWSGAHAMALLLGSGPTGRQSAGGTSLPVVLTPVMGLFKGQVGDGFVVPCVGFEVAVTVDRTARAGVSDCQRMQWTGDRWMIGPGPEPVQAPNVWPDSDAAIDVGFTDLAWQP